MTCNMQGTPPSDVLRRITSAAGRSFVGHAEMTMHCTCTSNKTTPVCASELSLLCLHDSGTTIITIGKIISMIVSIIINIIVIERT